MKAKTDMSSFSFLHFHLTFVSHSFNLQLEICQQSKQELWICVRRAPKGWTSTHLYNRNILCLSFISVFMHSTISHYMTQFNQQDLCEADSFSDGVCLIWVRPWGEAVNVCQWVCSWMRRWWTSHLSACSLFQFTIKSNSIASQILEYFTKRLFGEFKIEYL